MRKFSLLAILACMIAPNAAIALDIRSDFDSGLDGWTNELGDGSTTWASSGGNPGGYIAFNDNFEASFIVAPAKFRGNWSALNNVGKIFYDHRLFATGGSVIGFQTYQVRISGPGGAAVWNGSTPTGPTQWLRILVHLIQSEWTVTQGTWTGLLQNVTDFRIKIEMVSNNGFGEINGVDNVRLTDARTERACPDAMNVVFGTVISGTVASVCESDNQVLSIRNGNPFLITQSPITVEFIGGTTITQPTLVRLICEYRVTLAGLTLRLDLRNQKSASWEQVLQKAASTTEDIVTHDQLQNPGDYVTAQGDVAFRIRVKDDSPAFLVSWNALVDQFVADVSNK